MGFQIPSESNGRSGASLKNETGGNKQMRN